MTPDHPDRQLTEAEQRGVEIYRETLLELCHYLSYTAPGQRTFPDALAKREPVMLRAAEGALVPIAVYPQLVCQWLTADGRRAPSATMVAEALAFMGAKEATTLRPHGEPASRVRRRPGWFRLSPEMISRIKLTCFVPVLTPPVGRVARQTLRLDERAGMVKASTKPVAAPTVEQMMTLLRDYLSNGETPTLLLSLAALHNAPLLPRKSGRPRTFSPTLAYDTLRAYLHPNALVAHLETHGSRLNMSSMTTPTLTRGLTKLHRDRPELVRPMGWIRAIDTASTTRATGWHEVSAALLLGHDLMITAQAEREYDHFTGWRKDWERVKGEKPTTAQMQQFAALYPVRFPS